MKLSQEEIDEASIEIRAYIPDFDYATLLYFLRNTADLKARFHATSVGYEKVQLFRILSVLHPAALGGDDIFTKFVNESYHIENEYVMQLNPKDFDAVPEYVIDSCTALLSNVSVA